MSLTLLETEIAIKFIKDSFSAELAKQLKLTRVSAPLFLHPETGLNDNLSGTERPVAFDAQGVDGNLEIVQSLAKWKRYALARYGFAVGTGLYTDMNAIRRDETADFLHSYYVDQWDWEQIILPSQRTYSYLKKVVKRIYLAISRTAEKVMKKFPQISLDMPEGITFISTKELEKKYPELSPKEREIAITKEYKAVFLYQIGWPLSNKQPHDKRAADYDDWKLNGDILLWHEPLSCAMEVSSMGIRVDKDSLVKQLKKKGELSKLENPYCRGIVEGKLPLTVGGGIGQSRLCMYLLKKQHVGEVQSSVWSKDEEERAQKAGIILL